MEDILKCPKCKNEVHMSNNKLICSKCKFVLKKLDCDKYTVRRER